MSQRSITADIVSVFVYRRGRVRAECTCGWESRDRRRRGRAVFDALLHAAQTGCRENWPLVYDEGSSRRSLLAPAGWLAMACAIIGGAVYLSAPAHADAADDYAAANYSVICETISEKPYVSTVVAVVDAVVADSGKGYRFAGEVVGVSVRDYCPWNRGTVERFIAAYLPAQPINAVVGGRI